MMLDILILVLSIIHSRTALEITSWTLTNEKGSIIIKNVTSPVDVYSALYDSYLINWPLDGYNDVTYRFIAFENWTFASHPFTIPPSNSTLLSVSGLDIYPIVTLNGHLLNISTSEFSSSEIEIDPSMLKPSDNIFRLKFISPPLMAEVLSKEYKVSVPPDCWPKIFNGECHINFLRKTQSSFGWDWGPAIPTMGIRGKVELLFTTKTLAIIKGVRFLTTSDDHCKEWMAEVIVKTRVLQASPTSTICIKIIIQNLQKEVIKCIKTNDTSIYYTTWGFKTDSKHLKLWWPYEMGTPTAYKLEVQVTYGTVVLDRYVAYVGFRRVDLDQSLIPGSVGRYFKFTVNCRPFFVKGTNWVPRSYLSTAWKNESYLEFLLASVVHANINTIRLWGGGRPETDLFYSIADRLGIMIWHDLMFAGSLYPTNEGFYNQITNEITVLLWNIQIHPSILIWSGNNEVELLIAQGWYNTSKMDPRNIDDYYKTFDQLIKPLISMLDPFTPFVLSSPSNGIESERHKGVSKDPQSVYYGDVHFYLYSGDLWDERSYPISRMTTEFGFQSYPSTSSWTQIVTAEEDFQPNGTLVNHRQHHPDGFKQIYNTLIQYFGKVEPRGSKTAREKYSWFSYLSQINQAMILKVHINRLRSSQCYISSTGEGYTSGAMFWQLNDNWVAPSWSTINANGQWKTAHYYIRNAFAKRRIVINIQDNTIILRLILPDATEASKYVINMMCIDVSRNISSAITGARTIEIDSKDFPCNVVTVLSQPLSSFLTSCKCVNISKCIVSGTLLQNGKVTSRDETMVVKPKDVHLPEEVLSDRISVKIQNGDPDFSVCLINLKAKFVHLYVTLSTPSMGSFSNNGFHLWHEAVNITFSPWYYNQMNFVNCSVLSVEVKSLNTLLE